MTGLSRSTEGLDPRKKRLLYRAWHRGTREMDLLMGRFAEAVIDGLSDADLARFEALIDVADRDLFAWIASGAAVPAEFDTPLLGALKAFHRHDAPLDL